MTIPQTFSHHRLDVYRVALDAMRDVVVLSERIPRGHRSMADQMKRSATGMVALIAEGANRRTAAEQKQRFTEARGETGETAAWLEIGLALGHIRPEDARPIGLKLERVGQMLTRLIRPRPG